MYKQRKMAMRFETWNVKSLYNAGCCKTVASELEKCKLYLVREQEVRCEEDDNEPADDYTFYFRQDNAYHKLGTEFFI
jgi:hypothetical protein